MLDVENYYHTLAELVEFDPRKMLLNEETNKRIELEQKGSFAYISRKT